MIQVGMTPHPMSLLSFSCSTNQRNYHRKTQNHQAYGDITHLGVFTAVETPPSVNAIKANQLPHIFGMEATPGFRLKAAEILVCDYARYGRLFGVLHIHVNNKTDSPTRSTKYGDGGDRKSVV